MPPSSPDRRHAGPNLIGNVRVLRIDKCVLLALFVLLTLFPLPWVWWNPTSGHLSR